MGLIRKTLAVASAIAVPAASRNGQPGFIKYRSEAEEARREQTALLREQTELLRRQTQQAQPSRQADRFTAEDHERAQRSGEYAMTLVWFCQACIDNYCHGGADVNTVKNPKLCDCAAHHT